MDLPYSPLSAGNGSGHLPLALGRSANPESSVADCGAVQRALNLASYPDAPGSKSARTTSMTF